MSFPNRIRDRVIFHLYHSQPPLAINVTIITNWKVMDKVGHLIQARSVSMCEGEYSRLNPNRYSESRSVIPSFSSEDPSKSLCKRTRILSPNSFSTREKKETCNGMDLHYHPCRPRWNDGPAPISGMCFLVPLDLVTRRLKPRRDEDPRVNVKEWQIRWDLTSK